METPSRPAKAAFASAAPSTQVLTVSPTDRRHASGTGTATTTTIVDAEDTARRRRWRRRRVEKVEHMRAHVARMEQIVLALPLVDDADQIWDAFLDDETKHTRDALRRLVPAAREVQGLLFDKHQLQSLLAEHKLASETVQGLLREETADDWDSNVVCWKRLAREHFRPWKAAQCVAEINAAMIEAHKFAVSHDKQSTGLSVMGWEDSRRVDATASTLQFSMHKTYHGYDLDHQLTEGWRIYTDSALYTKLMLADRGHAHIDVLQQLTPRVCVVLYHLRYDGVVPPTNFHALAILATIETDDGAMFLVRSVEAPELQQVLDRPDDAWASMFYWKQFEILDRTKPRSKTDFRAAVQGTVHNVDLAHVDLWLFEVLATLVRSEPRLTGRSLLTF